MRRGVDSAVKPEGSFKDTLSTEEKKRKLQAQVEVVARSDSAVGAVANTNQPVKILKTESTFAKTFGQRAPNKEKKISFADEHGKNIADNVFCDQLHYSTANFNSSEMQKGCCTVS